jgi:2-methylcitrate dehydratase PrpD
MQVFSDKTDWAEITENLGQTWEIALNTYKPFACGIVIHPAIDACVQLRNQHALTADQIARITVRAHPLVQELTGKKTPQTGLESKFSVFHSCAVAIMKGQAGEHEYADDVVRSPEVIALRDRVELVVDRQIHEASVDVTIETTDGRSLHIFIERAIGSLEKPMTNELLKAKFVDQSAPILGAVQAEQAWLACMGLANQPDLKTVLKSLSPI